MRSPPHGISPLADLVVSEAAAESRRSGHVDSLQTNCKQLDHVANWTSIGNLGFMLDVHVLCLEIKTYWHQKSVDVLPARWLSTR